MNADRSPVGDQACREQDLVGLAAWFAARVPVCPKLAVGWRA